MIVTVARSTVLGMTPDHLRRYNERICEIQPTIFENLAWIKKGPDHEGCHSRLMHINMPMFMSDRVFVNLYYNKENRDGSFEYIGSSQGNQEVVN